MIRVNVLVVGGGPAGASLSYQLQKNGITCCLIDRAAFPRKKLCGGLLTIKTVALIEDIYNERQFPVEKISNHVSLFYKTEKLSEVNTNSPFYLVDRLDFDNYFVDKYRELGGLFFENTTVTSFAENKNEAILSTGEKIEYDFLVGADGANSPTRKLIDKKYKPNAICVEFDTPDADVNDEIQVYFAPVRSGYGWRFPKQKKHTVGMGGTIVENKDLRTAFTVFCKSIGQEINGSIAGALIPYGHYVKKPALENKLLIGDAAGLVDPITGEGLYFAFYSAKCAFEALNDAINTGKSAEAAYLKKVTAVQKIIRSANRFNYFLFNDVLKHIFLKMIRGKTHITQYFCENVLSNYNVSYNAFVLKYLKVRRERKKQEKGQ